MNCFCVLWTNDRETAKQTFKWIKMSQIMTLTCFPLLISSGCCFHSLCPPLSASSDGFISHTDVFSESYPSMDVRERPPVHWQKQWPLYNIIYHPGAFVQHPVSYGGQQPVRGWHSVWQASADAKWQWHKEGAHHAGPDRAVFHREEAWLDLKAQPKIRLQPSSWHLFGLVFDVCNFPR